MDKLSSSWEDLTTEASALVKGIAGAGPSYHRRDRLLRLLEVVDELARLDESNRWGIPYERPRRRSYSGSLYDQIGQASEAVAVAEKQLLEKIGEALATPGGPNWADIGRIMNRLNDNGDIEPAPVSRQAARQRFSHYKIVQRRILMTRIERQERELHQRESQVYSVGSRRDLNAAEKEVVVKNLELEIEKLSRVLETNRGRLSDLYS